MPLQRPRRPPHPLAIVAVLLPLCALPALLTVGPPG
jgi:hypothetical protein